MAGAGNAIRGSRVGAGPMGEAERGDAAPRQTVTYFCSHDHRSVVTFAIEANVPESWDCPKCGLPASLDSENPPPAPKIEPYKTHLAYVKERRCGDRGRRHPRRGRRPPPLPPQGRRDHLLTELGASARRRRRRVGASARQTVPSRRVGAAQSVPSRRVCSRQTVSSRRVCSAPYAGRATARARRTPSRMTSSSPASRPYTSGVQTGSMIQSASSPNQPNRSSSSASLSSPVCHSRPWNSTPKRSSSLPTSMNASLDPRRAPRPVVRAEEPAGASSATAPRSRRPTADRPSVCGATSLSVVTQRMPAKRSTSLEQLLQREVAQTMQGRPALSARVPAIADVRGRAPFEGAWSSARRSRR